MNIGGHDVGVCSWSLRPTGMLDLVEKVRDLGLGHLQMALLPLLETDEVHRREELAILRDSGLQLTATMMSFPGEDYATIARIRETGGYVSTKDWPERRELSLEGARLTAAMGVKRLGVHVGFVPPPSQSGYAVMVERIRELTTGFADLGVELMMETGQEPASELLRFINDLAARNVGVNFDPANMILYGAGDPIDAIRTLGRHIRHIHVKDGVLSRQPGVEWGEEVPFGTGQVGPKAFLSALNEIGYTGAMCIEREQGESRMADVRTAIESLKRAGTR